MDKKFDVKKLIQISLLIAIEVILTRFCSINTPIVRIGFGFLPIAIIAMMYGPLSAGIAYALGDILGMMLFSSGSFFPGFTLTAFLTGIVYGAFLYNKPKTWPRIIGAVLTVCLVINLGLDTYWLSILMGKGYIALLPTRIIKSVLMIPVQTLIIGIIWKKVVIRFTNISHA
ncbi:folate family ECF transporter S component [Terrisporobacter sp.]